MLRNNQSRARAVRVLFVLYAVVCTLVVVLSLLGLASPDLTVASAEHLPAALFVSSYGLSLVLMVLLYVAAMVLFIMWLRRAYYNLHQLPGVYLDYSDGWAAGAWFVPFLNLVRPYTITREVWLVTQRVAFGRELHPATVLGWWWTAFVLKLVASRLANGISSDGNSISPGNLSLLLVDGLISLAFAVLTWRIVGQARQFEQQLALYEQVNQLGQPAPEVPAALQAEQTDYGQAEGY